MYLEKIKLTHFKNYELAALNFSSRLNCFVGLNGMGKTNLLDAIYYLCMGKSHFRMTDRNIVLYEKDFFRLEGNFKRKEKKEKIVAKVIPGQKKVMERNDVAYPKISEHVGFLPVVMIAPDDTQLATEGSEERRRFLDNTLSQVDANYLSQLLIYNKILRQRNAALKQMAIDRNYNVELIHTYNEQLIAPANVIHQKRKLFIENFQPTFNLFYKKISGGNEKVNITYRSQLDKDAFKDLLESTMEKDRILHRTTTGVHKDDIVVKLGTHALKRFGSQGQLKSFVLAMKLAQYNLLQKEKDLNPILLLDDIFDKLDTHRVQFLLKLLVEQSFGQIFLTDTHKQRVEELVKEMNIPFQIFEIADGAVISK